VAGLRLVVVAQLVEQRVQPHVAAVELERPGLDLRDAEHLADDVFQPPRFLVDHVQRLGAHGRVALALLDGGLDVESNVGQRRAWRKTAAAPLTNLACSRSSISTSPCDIASKAASRSPLLTRRSVFASRARPTTSCVASRSFSSSRSFQATASGPRSAPTASA